MRRMHLNGGNLVLETMLLLDVVLTIENHSSVDILGSMAPFSNLKQPISIYTQWGIYRYKEQ